MELLEDNPTLLLFVVAGGGFLLARVRIAGFSLGVAAVLFAGIAVGAVDPDLKLPEPIWTLGLALFVYTVGLASGPGFVAALRRRGLAANALVFGVLAGAGVLVVAGGALLGVTGATAAGTFAGGLTNTPALAAILDGVKQQADAGELDRLLAEPIVGYSLTYPAGVLVPLVAVAVLLRRHAASGASRPLVTRTARVEHGGRTLGSLREQHGHAVTFGRVVRDEHEQLVAADELRLEAGDLVTVVAHEDELDAVIAELGHPSTHHISLDRAEVDFRRVFVSDARLAGRRLGDLDLAERFDATATRVRRGDVDFLATPDVVLELGDRVLVVAPRKRLGDVSRFFGDSYRALGEVDVLTLSAGLAAGLLLGAVPVPLPGGGTFELGSAGGPLLVALALGAVGRSGPLVWQLPYSANLTLRQFGLVLFLAGVGTRAGESFGSTITDPDALLVIALGLAVTTAASLAALATGTKVLRLPPATLAGVVAGLHTQPAVLAYASGRFTDDTEVNVGYATVYPFAMIAKIVAANVLVALLL